MKFKQYLTEEWSRSKKMDTDKALEWAEKYAKKALDNARKGNIIYRGSNAGFDALIVSPSQSKKPRKSAYVGSNYYTLLMDNLPSWKQYPKRSQSIICTTDINKSDDYGEIYIVLPKDGSRIGVCSDGDIFDSFRYLFREVRMFSMRAFSKSMVELSSLLGLGKSDYSWKGMIKMFKTIDTLGSMATNEWYSDLLGGDTLKKMDEMMHPKKNKFTLKKSGDILPHSREVWTDGESVMFKFDVFEELSGVSGEGSDFVVNYPIDKLLIMRDDLYRAYSNFNKPYYKPSDSVTVWYEIGGNEDRYMAVNNLAPVIHAIMSGKSTINLTIDGSGRNPYSTVKEQWKYQRRMKFKGLEDLASDEALADDKEDWGY